MLAEQLILENEKLKSELQSIKESNNSEGNSSKLILKETELTTMIAYITAYKTLIIGKYWCRILYMQLYL